MNELVRWDPFEAVLPGFFRIASSGPRMDVAENDVAYQLAVEIPGAQKEAIQVSVYENSVTISTELPQRKEEDGAQWLLRERSVGNFSRTISLPEAVDDEASEARYVDGVLYLTLKKRSASQTKRLTIH